MPGEAIRGGFFTAIIAVAIASVMLFGTYVVVVVPPHPLASRATVAGPDCLPCPGGSGCAPDSGCDDPTGTVQISTPSLSVNQTNISIEFTLSTNASVTLQFGNTSALGFVAINNVEYPTGQLTVHQKVDFLEPATKYYYKISAGTYCMKTGTYAGTWTTQSESTYISSYGYIIQGTVFNSAGVRAGANLIVEAWCVSQPNGWYGWSYTNSTGHYSIDVYDQYDQSSYCTQWGSGGAQACDVVFGLGTNANWVGYWNETVAVWAPQVVNFYLPPVWTSSYIPEVLDFSNAPAGYGSIGYQAAYSTTTTLEHDWSVSGGILVGAGASGSTSVTQSFGSSNGPNSNSGTLDWGAEYRTVTGMIFFNAVYRAWNVTSMDLIDIESDGFASQYGVNPPTDYLSPGHLPSDAYYLLDSNGLPYKDKLTPSNFGYSGQVQTSTTVATTASFSLSFSISAPLPGGQALSFSANTGWTQTSSTSSGWDLSWTIGDGAQPACYDVFGEGGNPNTYPIDNTDMIGIWYWAPVNGVCTGG